MNAHGPKILSSQTQTRRDAQVSFTRKTTQKNHKNSLAVFVFVALLGSGGLFLMNQHESFEKDQKKQIVNSQKAEFIKKFLMLSKSEFEQVPQINKNPAHTLHKIDAKNLPAAVPGVNRQIGQAHDHSISHHAPESTPPSYEDDEQRKAQESEALSLSHAEQIEAAHTEERDDYRQKIAEQEARYQQAMDQVNAQITSTTPSSTKIHQSIPYRLMMKTAYMVPENPEFGLFKGAITKCYISGHDMHWIDPSGWILKHVEKDEPVTGNVLVAREIINSSEKGVVVTVYENGYEIYDSQGTLISAGNRK